MPTYAYRCEACQKECEFFQKITDAPETLCPHCGKQALKRGIGGGNIAFQFKGSGFYETDYKKTNPSSSCCPCGKDKGSCSN
jgi:putative FmdB family regulatory protein